VVATIRNEPSRPGMTHRDHRVAQGPRHVSLVLEGSSRARFERKLSQKRSNCTRRSVSLAAAARLPNFSSTLAQAFAGVCCNDPDCVGSAGTVWGGQAALLFRPALSGLVPLILVDLVRLARVGSVRVVRFGVVLPDHSTYPKQRGARPAWFAGTTCGATCSVGSVSTSRPSFVNTRRCSS
jgi:hypothetical protein